MLFLGHACWGFVIGKFAAARLGSKPNIYLMMLLGMLPDIDLVLGVFGIPHRTVTHSIIFWGLIFAPLIWRYKWAAIPYFVAVAQHVLFGDLVVGKTSILWPLEEPRLGLGLQVLSPVNLALEAAGAILLVTMLRKEQQSNFQRWRLAGVAVIAVLVSFAILASFGDSIIPLVIEGSDARHLEKNLPLLLQSPYLVIAVVSHLAIAVFLAGTLVKKPIARVKE